MKNETMSRSKTKKKILVFTTLFAAIVLFSAFSPQPVFATYEEGRYIGIDVSSWNGTLDWDRAVAVGVEFAIIRIGWGSDYKNQDDPQAIRNMQECERLGIPYGVYIYSYALNLDEVDSEIQHTLRMINGFHPTLGVWFDMEDADFYKDRYGMDPYTHGAELNEFCLRYMRGIRNAGYSPVGVYANTDYFNNVLDYYGLKQEGLIWLAHWGPVPGWPYDMWQFTAEGMTAINGNVFDTNLIDTESVLSQLVFEIPFQITTFKRKASAPFALGDITGDGKISLADLSKLKDHLTGKIVLGKSAKACADVNLDGVITLSDLTLIKKHIVGASTLKTTDSATSESKSEALEPVTEAVQQDGQAEETRQPEATEPSEEKPEPGALEQEAPAEETRQPEVTEPEEKPEEQPEQGTLEQEKTAEEETDGGETEESVSGEEVPDEEQR